MVHQFHAYDARVDVVDILIFAAAVAACGFFFLQGGVGGVIGAVSAALLGWLRPFNPQARWRSAFKNAVAGLWAGAMIAGVCVLGLVV